MGEKRDFKIVINGKGSWFSPYGEVTHPGVKRYFQSILEKRENGLVLDNGRQQVEVVAKGFIFFVEAIREREYEGKPWIWLVINDGTEEPLNPESLVILRDNSIICSIKGGKFKAKFTLSAYWQLVEHVVEENGKFFLKMGDMLIPLREEGNG